MKVRITLPEMQKALARVKPREGITFVELEGVEPSSKQGNHTLSTRFVRSCNSLIFNPLEKFKNSFSSHFQVFSFAAPPERLRCGAWILERS